jgi:hypothetical protein
MRLFFVISILAVQVFGLDMFFVDSLSSIQLPIYNSAINSFVIEDYSDKTIGTLLKEDDPIAKRLCNYAAWLLIDDKPLDYVLDKLNRRALTFFPPDTFTLSTGSITPIGDTSSPVKVTVYIAADCGYCKKVGIPLADLTEGPLNGKLYFEMKPIHKKIGDYALLAANEQGKAWELFREYGNIHTRLETSKVIEAASKTTIIPEIFSADMEKNNDRYEKQLDENHNESVENGLKFTPTLFFNNHLYRSNRHPIWIIDYVEFLLEPSTK